MSLNKISNNIEDRAGFEIFKNAFKDARAAGKGEAVSYLRGWIALEKSGYEEQDGVWKLKANYPENNELFTFSHEVNKINEEQRLIYGWASVIEKDGKSIEDHQGDIIKSSELVNAAHNFISSSRTAKALHQGSQIGEFVESVVFTSEVQKALGIDLGKVGWWVVLKVADDNVWKAVKQGKLKMLSIGGRGKRVDNG